MQRMHRAWCILALRLKAVLQAGLEVRREWACLLAWRIAQGPALIVAWHGGDAAARKRQQPPDALCLVADAVAAGGVWGVSLSYCWVPISIRSAIRWPVGEHVARGLEPRPGVVTEDRGGFRLGLQVGAQCVRVVRRLRFLFCGSDSGKRSLEGVRPVKYR